MMQNGLHAGYDQRGDIALLASVLDVELQVHSSRADAAGLDETDAVLCIWKLTVSLAGLLDLRWVWT